MPTHARLTPFPPVYNSTVPAHQSPRSLTGSHYLCRGLPLRSPLVSITRTLGGGGGSRQLDPDADRAVRRLRKWRKMLGEPRLPSHACAGRLFGTDCLSHGNTHARGRSPCFDAGSQVLEVRTGRPTCCAPLGKCSAGYGRAFRTNFAAWPGSLFPGDGRCCCSTRVRCRRFCALAAIVHTVHTQRDTQSTTASTTADKLRRGSGPEPCIRKCG